MNSTWVVISYVWPEPQSSAAGIRSLNVVRGLRQAGHCVVIASAAQNDIGLRHCEALAAASKGAIEVVPIRLNDSGFDSWLAGVAPEGVVYDRFVVEEQFGSRVRAAVPQVVQVLDTQDLHFLRLSRQQQGRDLSTQSRELAAIHRVDLSWLVSDHEHRLLVEEFGIAPSRLALSRFAYPKREVQAGDGFAARRGFAMIGNFRHAPNLDAFRWLKAEIWPLIRRRLPSAEIRIFGAYPTKEVLAASVPREGFFVEGVAESLMPVFARARVSLAPLRFGAGIKGKVTDSWWHGVPVAGTPIAAEGMGDLTIWGGLVGHSAEEIAERAVELHEDEAQWAQAQKQGFALMDGLFSEVAFQNSFESDLIRAKAAAKMRSEDWLKQVLLHASNDSTRYFSRWIELKEGQK